jgi:hypothetical protein
MEKTIIDLQDNRYQLITDTQDTWWIVAECYGGRLNFIRACHWYNIDWQSFGLLVADTDGCLEEVWLFAGCVPYLSKKAIRIFWRNELGLPQMLCRPLDWRQQLAA